MFKIKYIEEYLSEYVYFKFNDYDCDRCKELFKLNEICFISFFKFCDKCYNKKIKEIVLNKNLDLDEKNKLFLIN